MAINSFSTLKDAVANYLYRDDLSAQIPDFIYLAEIQFNRDLDLRVMESVMSGTLTTPNITLPTNVNAVQRVVISANSRTYDLKYASPQTLSQYSVSTGLPEFWTELDNQLYVIPSPDAQYAYQVFYRAELDHLSDTTATNWMIVNAPDVYLYGSLLAATPFLQDDGRIATWQMLYNNAIKGLQANDDASRYPVGTALEVRSDNQPYAQVTW